MKRKTLRNAPDYLGALVGVQKPKEGGRRIEFTLIDSDARYIAESLGLRALVLDSAAVQAGARAPLLRDRAAAMRALRDQITLAVEGDAA